MRKFTPLTDAPMTRALAVTFTVLGFVQNRVDARSDRGATAVEYGLMVGLIAVVIIVAVTALGGQLTGLFEDVTDGLIKAKPATTATTVTN